MSKLIDRVVDPRQLTVVFQPILTRGADGWRLLACEGLVRGPVGTNLYTPEVLFAYARRKRAEAPVDRACIRAILESAGPLGIDAHINVNVHGITLEQDRKFVPHLAELLEVLRFAPSRLTLEIVEHSVSGCSARLVGSLAGLRELGVGIALDDIGLGQSNYRMILETRPNYFKIDRYLVSGCSRDSGRRAIVGSIGHLAESLDATAVAEGVDNSADLTAIVSQGVSAVQGFLLARPHEAEYLGSCGRLSEAARRIPATPPPSWPEDGDWLLRAVATPPSLNSTATAQVA